MVRFLELNEKDGYLATNSLLLDAVLITRAYGELDTGAAPVPQSIGDLRVGGVGIHEWITAAQAFIDAVVDRGAVVVTFSPQLNSIAVDL